MSWITLKLIKTWNAEDYDALESLLKWAEKID